MKTKKQESKMNGNHLRQRETLERINNPDYLESINKEKDPPMEPARALMIMTGALNVIRLTTTDLHLRKMCENVLRSAGQLIEVDDDDK